MSGIVVGVDGSAGSKHALEWAASEASLRGVPLTLLLTWEVPTGIYAGAGWSAITPELIDDLEKLAHDRLDDTCRAPGDVLKGLAVQRMVIQGAPAPTLIEAAAEAELLVVGTRGHGGFVGLLLGSVSQQCAHHSPCPIAIVRHPRARRAFPCRVSGFPAALRWRPRRAPPERRRESRHPHVRADFLWEGSP